MSEIELIIITVAIGLFAIFVIIALSVLSRQVNKLHKDVRRTIELGFWSQRRERKILKK
jgi:hypothetical protein